MAAPDENDISPYLRRAPRSQREVEEERAARAARSVAARRQRLLDRAFDRLSRDELRYEVKLLIAESRSTDDPEQRQLLADQAFELAQLAECKGRLLSEISVAPSFSAPVGANENANRLLEKARRWRMRAEEYRTVAEALQHPSARESYLHLARTYETLADSWEVRVQLLRGLRSG